MHALTMLRGILARSCPGVHAKRLNSLLAAVEAAVSGSRLALSDLGRGLRSGTAVKHNIKRVDRLLGNGAMHDEIPELYRALAQQCLEGVATPLIVVDWSDLTPDRCWQLLRASIALEGRSVTLFEEVHPLSRLAASGVHRRFLKRLAAMLPPGCVPILVTDAGFRSTWFKLVNRMGWHWIGRIRNRDMVRPIGADTWAGCTTLYAKATARAHALGEYEYVRTHPVPCRLVLIKRMPKGRHKKSRHGQAVRSSHSLKQARGQREPWLLAACPGLAHLSPEAVVAIYAQRMQIEEAFRDLKSERFGLGFSANRSTQRARLGILLLIACLASFLLRLIGEAGRAQQLEFQFQSNTRRVRPVLSVISLALQLVQRGLATFTQQQFNAALARMRCSSPALEV
jgi:hypothetical protein